jgi:hypothetical protein
MSVLLFRRGNAMKKAADSKRKFGPQLRLYNSQTLSTTNEEKLFFEIVSMLEGLKPATVARRLMYRGLAQYLKDGQLRLPEPEPVIHAEMVKLVETDPTMKQIKQIIEQQPARGATAKDTKNTSRELR